MQLKSYIALTDLVHMHFHKLRSKNFSDAHYVRVSCCGFPPGVLNMQIRLDDS